MMPSTMLTLMMIVNKVKDELIRSRKVYKNFKMFAYTVSYRFWELITQLCLNGRALEVRSLVGQKDEMLSLNS